MSHENHLLKSRKRDNTIPECVSKQAYSSRGRRMRFSLVLAFCVIFAAIGLAFTITGRRCCARNRVSLLRGETGPKEWLCVGRLRRRGRNAKNCYTQQPENNQTNIHPLWLVKHRAVHQSGWGLFQCSTMQGCVAVSFRALSHPKS